MRAFVENYDELDSECRGIVNTAYSCNTGEYCEECGEWVIGYYTDDAEFFDGNPVDFPAVRKCGCGYWT